MGKNPQVHLIIIREWIKYTPLLYKILIIQPPPTLMHFIHPPPPAPFRPLLPTIKHARELNITIFFVFKKVSLLLKKWDTFFCLVLTKYFWELINFFATNSLCFLLPVTLAETLFVISDVTIYIYIYIYIYICLYVCILNCSFRDTIL